MRWQKITLIGVGLLGGSLGLALRERHLAEKVTGYVRRRASARECKSFGAVDEATLDLGEAVTGADLIVFCTPISRMFPIAQQMLPFIKPGTIITDVGSVKEGVVRDLEPLFAGVGASFVGGHPMAGGEKMGVSAARANLFEKAVCVVTPTGKKPSKPALRVEKLWKDLGGNVLRLSPIEHDELVSRSSHLPYIVASSLIQSVLGVRSAKHQGRLCATGFRDSTRVASGSPEMWRDISLANRKNLIAAVDVLLGNLTQVRRLLKSGDSEKITKFFETSKASRDRWLAQFDGDGAD